MPADTINRQLRGSFYRGNRLAFALAAAGALIGAVLNLIISWLMQQLIDTAAGTPGALPFSILVRGCGGFFLLLFCGSALVYCAKPRFLATAMEQYKNCAVTQLTQKSVPDFQRRPSAAYLSALTNDAATIEADYLTQQFTLIQKLFCFAGALALMLTYSLPLTLAAIMLSMLPFAVSMAAGNRLSDAACRVSDRNRDFTAFLSDCLNGFPVIRSFRAEDEINQRFASENHRLEQQKCTRLKLQTLLDSAGSFTGITAQLGIFLLGTWLALTGGEKQRIAIARALLKQSSILLADEATAALDAQTAYEITQDILSLTGITRVVVTHRLEASLLECYDEIFVLKDGRIAENGTFAELVQRGGYFSAMYKLAH